jgi:hypothetical protein
MLLIFPSLVAAAVRGAAAAVSILSIPFFLQTQDNVFCGAHRERRVVWICFAMAVSPSLSSLLSHLSCLLVSSIILFANVITYLFSILSPSTPLPLQPSQLLIVITGCDSGFGELLSKRFSQKGFRVISGCLTPNGIDNLKNVVTKAVLCDVTKETDLQQLAQEVEDISEQTNSKLWAVINNAGIADGGALDWTEVKIWKKVMEVNFFAVVGMIRTMLPFLKRTPGSRYAFLPFFFS